MAMYLDVLVKALQWDLRKGISDDLRACAWANFLKPRLAKEK